MHKNAKKAGDAKEISVAGEASKSITKRHDVSESPRESKSVKSFKEFREEFLREITLPDFGQDLDAVTDVDKLSPGAKELKEKGAHRVLSSEKFLRCVHGLLNECSRLSEEQGKVEAVRRKSGSSIKKIRDWQKTLAHLQAQIMGLDKRMADVLTWQRRAHFDNAVKELEMAQDILSSLERTEASHIHPQLRRRHDRIAGKRLEYTTSGFKSLLPPFDYELDSLKKKAPIQWLTEALDSELNRCFNRAKIEISSTTRYLIVAEIIASGGLPERSPNTIKEQFVEKRKLTKPPARNS